ncbi:MAG TPA: EVE domain-containing protein [Chitinophagales bacterium]|nr:EVE domain-containing protein [Chitinophagales bacterium]HMX05582.1 EVE domain-containing protein [Chitinophagales bacterium]HMZ90025.1 EVE domain-containing protein [Chitinophagales bacterium]HNA57255.1 EVE domain-containing protein [Chitinophagales bacterium]HNE46531.1 EVE domain-containing protein [Chitinophagales bacterium]
MQYWLIKSEPEAYSWDDLVEKKIDIWSGVRNYAARLHLRAMKKGDLCLFYHSGNVSACVGIAKVVKAAYPDPTAEEGDWSAVDVAPVKKLKREVSLKEIKLIPALADMPLVRISRLSVSPVTEFQYHKILDMSNDK